MCHGCLPLVTAMRNATCAIRSAVGERDAVECHPQNLAILGLNHSHPRGPWLHSRLGLPETHALEAWSSKAIRAIITPDIGEIPA